MRLVYVALLVSLAIGVAASDRYALLLSGYRPLVTPSVVALDLRGEPDDRQAPRFLADRNRVEVEIPWSMTVGEMLDLYQIDFVHVRQQIAEQEGLDVATDTHRLEEGTIFVLELTPVQESVP